MGGAQPFMYDSVPSGSPGHPYSQFDPKAISRASLTPKPPRPQQIGPLVSFNQHPDSYLVVPSGTGKIKAPSPSIKRRITRVRWVLLGIRCAQLVGSIGLLTTMILVNGVEPLAGWLMRIPPGAAILHTLYSVYHLSRRSSGRTPASSAYYNLFGAAFDLSLVPFYAFGSLVASGQYFKSRQENSWDGEWGTLLMAGQAAMPYLFFVAFYGFVVCGGLHVISFMLSTYLAITFRKIMRLPPDMNPLEDNLTSRHKRNKSSMSTPTMSERSGSVADSKRSSGAPYEDLSRPPSVPFMHTRQGSVESFTTYRSTPSSKDGRLDLPSRNYQIHNHSNASRSSVVELKRSSISYDTSPSKRGSYTEIPFGDPSNPSPNRNSRQMARVPEAWFTADSLPVDGRSSPRKGRNARYHPLQQQSQDFDADESFQRPHPHPLEANPPTPRVRPGAQRSSALTEISLNDPRRNVTSSGDLADMGREATHRENFKASFYGDLKPGAPPIMVGKSGERQVSSGNDFANMSFKVLERRDVSGKIAEEGRGGGKHSSWAPGFKK